MRKRTFLTMLGTENNGHSLTPIPDQTTPGQTAPFNMHECNAKKVRKNSLFSYSKIIITWS